MPPELARGRLVRLLLLLALAGVGAASSAQEPEEIWYRVEVLIFQHDDPGRVHREEEAWPAVMPLRYPPLLRALFDRERADAALATTPGALSHVDALGRQTLYLRGFGAVGDGVATLPGAPAATGSQGTILAQQIRAALAYPPPTPAALGSPQAPDYRSLIAVGAGGGANPGRAASADNTADTLPANTGGAGDEGPVPAPSSGAAGSSGAESAAAAPSLPPAFSTLPATALEFRAAAARMAAQPGWTIHWHRAWLQPMPEESASIPIVIDDSGDRPASEWPALQGSLRFHVSRYLHLEAGLWLNTDGQYLTTAGDAGDSAGAGDAAPARWRMPPPPRAPSRLRHATLDGQRVALWPLPPVAGEDAVTGDAVAGDARSGEARRADMAGRADMAAAARAAVEEDSPWGHAVALAQTRRMRSEEVHYIDHPVLGILVRLTPLDAAELQSWAERLQGTGTHLRGALLPLRPEQLALPAALERFSLTPQ